MSAFTFIKGIGIFPTTDMGPIMPRTEDRIRFEVIPPKTSSEEFKITFIHETELVLGFTVKNNQAPLKKNEEQEMLFDENHARSIVTPREFTEDELLSGAGEEDTHTNVLNLGENQIEVLRKKFKFYKRVLGSHEEYQIAISNIPSDTPPEEVMKHMERISEMAPSEKEKAKQTSRIEAIKETLSEAMGELLGVDEPSDDNMEKAISLIFNRQPDDDHNQKVKTMADSMLAEFYDDNFRDGFSMATSPVNSRGNNRPSNTPGSTVEKLVNT